MKTIRTLLIALPLALLTGLHAADAPSGKPNVIFILADDSGVGE